MKLLNKKPESINEVIDPPEVATPLGNIVFVRKLDGAAFERGIALPEQMRKNQAYPRGIVVATGPGRMLECGQWAPTGVKEGDKIVYNGPTGDLKLNGEELTVIDSSMVLCVLREQKG